MNRLSLLALCAFALVTYGSCSSDTPDDGNNPRGETNCIDQVDNDGNGLIDCADPACVKDPNCTEHLTPCSHQRGKLGEGGCGDIVVDLNIPICQDGFCRWPGPVNSDGKAATLQVDYDITFTGGFGDGGQDSEPQSFVARFIIPKTTDGRTLTCDDLVTLSGGKTATEAQRSLIDDDATINITFRNLAPFNWTTGKHFAWPDRLVARSTERVIFFAEAWFGPRAQGINLPSGNRAAFYCKPNIDLSGDAAVPLKFTFAPPQ